MSTTPGLVTRHLSRISIFILIGLVLMPATSGFAQGERESLRERIKERRADKRADKSNPDVSTDTRSTISQPGDYSFSIIHEGKRRLYRIHVPQSYNSTGPAPVLFAFHGGGGDMNHQANDANYGLISKSESAGFIAVFPNGYSKLRSGKLATWNAGNCCGDARDENIDDVGFIKKILANLKRRLLIDSKRIYATGMSNGAMMSYRLACELPGTFAGIAAVAGTDNTTTCSPEKPVAVLHIHAQNDSHVLFNGGAGNPFRDISKVTDFTSVPATVDKWVGLNQCSAKPQRVLEESGAYCELYDSCTRGAQVQLCVTETGGHSWPGGSKPRSDEPPSQAISANDVMWDFFQTLRNPTSTTR